MENQPDSFYKKYTALVWLLAGIIGALIGAYVYNILTG